MKDNLNEHKKLHKIYVKPLLSVVVIMAVFSLILFIALLEVSSNVKSREVSKASQEDLSGDSTLQGLAYNKEMTAVVKNINTIEKRITLLDIEQNTDIILSYSGGSNIIDKFGRVISIFQVPIGTMVDIGYVSATNMIKKMQISTKAWEYVGVNNFTIDQQSNSFKIASTKYRYTDQLVVIDRDNFKHISDLALQDELTVWGYKEIIWSITVTRGHGTVRIEDYDAFLGGKIAIGFEAIQTISENMVLKVREGNFNLTVENGAFSGTKNITVLRNEETMVSLGDLGPEPVKTGIVNFLIYPFGADLFINGKLTSYANPLELPYGEHKVELSLGGYTSYKGKLLVDEAEKTLKIDLPEQTRNVVNEPVVEEVQTSDSTDTDINFVEWNINTNLLNEDFIIDNNSYIYIQKPIGATVYLNGEYMGVTPGRFKKIVGTHVITFFKTGHEMRSYTIEVRNDGLDAYFSMPNLVRIEE